MDENKFWLRIWQTIAATAAVVAMTIEGCVSYETKRIADAVASGADPIDARCGIAGTSNGGTTICTLRAVKMAQ